MVKVDFNPLGGGQAAQILVIRIVLEEGYPIRTDALEDGLGDRGLTGPGATGDANDKGGYTFGHNKMIILVLMQISSFSMGFIGNCRDLREDKGLLGREQSSRNSTRLGDVQTGWQFL